MNNIPKILQDLYLKNLAFFKIQNPSIYTILTNTKPDHSKIIITESGEVDLNYKGKPIYGGDAIKYAEAEVEEFKTIYKSGKRKSSMAAVCPGLYSAPRFFHRHIDQTIRQLYIKAERVELNAIYHNNRHDFLIITGIGLGLHISEIIDKMDVQNILILETDFELLALSCFFTDWESIYEKQSPKKKKSISLLLLNGKDFETEKGTLWNELIKRAPHFPHSAISYNHGRHDKYGEMLKKLSSDITMFTSLWGYYDDEVNQLNHTMHNINNDIKLIPKRNDFKWEKPIIICGSGPSLDSRIEQLKSIRNKCILVSAGSSLHALIKYDLTPDYHVELESDYGVYQVLETIDEKILKKITLICALQCSPHITTMFKNCYAFIKDSMSIGSLIEKPEDKLIEPTPTCVNAALSFAFQYQAKEILLFGTDFGFYSESEHHSKNSMYENSDISNDKIEEMKEITKKMMKVNIKKPGYKGECLTTETYFTTKRRIEMSIYFNMIRYSFKLYNFSDGLIIDKAQHIKQDHNIKIDHNIKSKNIFKEKSRKTGKHLNNLIEVNLYTIIKNLCDIMIEHTKKTGCDIESFSYLCWSISHHINTDFYKKHDTLVFFIRGTVWHYMLAGYSIVYSAEYEKQTEMIKIWKERFIDFLSELPKDLKNTIEKDRSSKDNDIQLRRTIREEVS